MTASTGSTTDQAPADPAATDEMLASQPIGYWTGRVHAATTGHLRDAMARIDVTQPQYWVLNCVNSAPTAPSWQQIVDQLTPLADNPRDIPRTIDQLLHRAWLSADDADRLHLTEPGETARAQLRDLVTDVRAELHDGVTDEQYVAALKVLRQVLANVEATRPA